MEAKLSYKKEESYGVVEFAPETEAEYYALRHWIDHATNCGLPRNMITLQIPLWVVKAQKKTQQVASSKEEGA